MNSTQNACRFLESLQRYDLSMLLRTCSSELVDVEDFFGLSTTEACIKAASPIDEALKQLPPEDRKRIAEAIAANYSNKQSPEDIIVTSDGSSRRESSEKLLAELIIHRQMMIDVATGGARIQDVNDYYRARSARIQESSPKDFPYENPHEDLWDWYRYWSNNLPQYKDRRFYIRNLFASAIETISKTSKLPSEPREATGWERLDRSLAKARSLFQAGSDEEDWQAIGLICREATISLAQAVFNPSIHETLDGVEASETDAKRMLEAYIASAFPGSSNKEVRAHARASLALALNLQHRRTATRQLAELCLEATSSSAAVISIIYRSKQAEQSVQTPNNITGSNDWSF